jgi:hypothetical protein
LGELHRRVRPLAQLPDRTGPVADALPPHRPRPARPPPPREEAPALPHPALEQAARAHADFLAFLANSGNLLGRQVVLTAREHPGTQQHQSGGRVLQRLDEAHRALVAAEITVTALTGPQSAALITAACNPDTQHPTQPGPEGMRR